MVSVATLWLIYLIVLIVFLLIGWVLLSVQNHSSLGLATVLIFASTVAAIIVFLCMIWLDQASDSSRLGAIILVFLAVLLPIVALVWFFKSGEYASLTDYLGEHVKEEVVCNPSTGQCYMTSRQVLNKGVVTDTVYHRYEDLRPEFTPSVSQ